MTARKTGNELFDIFWKEYPARNGRKNTKNESLEWFKKKKPSEETVFDMIEWLKRDKESRSSLESSGLFCSPPKDAIRFLRKGVWTDEISEVVTESSQYEANRSDSIRKNAVKSAIDSFKDIIHERTPEELRKNTAFMFNYGKYSEFRKWVNEELPNRKKADKADNPPCPPPPEAKKAVATPDVAILKPDIVQDLPPPSGKIDRIMEFVGDVKQAKADGRIEQMVQKSQLF